MELLFVTTREKTKERFAVKPTATGKNINFWHDDGQRLWLYTFVQNDKYSRHIIWTEKICRELLAELRKPTPGVTVVRFAIDGLLVFSDIETPAVPAMPKAPAPNQLKATPWYTPSRKAEYEEKRSSEPAPYILYGVFSRKNQKEYAWRLTPDKHTRQGILPGHRVFVWTRRGLAKVTVTKIEEAGDLPQPEYRVKRKLTLKELAAERAERKPTLPDEG